MVLFLCIVAAVICYLLYKILKRTDSSLVLALAEKFGKSPG